MRRLLIKGRLLPLVIVCACAPSREAPLRFEPEVRAVVASNVATVDPKLLATTSGSVFLISVVKEVKSWLGVSMSHDGGDSFSPPIRLNKADTVVKSHGENSPEAALGWPYAYVVWEEAAETGTRLMLGGFNRMNGQVKEPVQIFQKKVPSMNGFPSLAIAPDGALTVVWLDGRAEGRTPPGTFAVYMARSTDGGRTFTEPKEIALSVCPCCRPAVVSGPRGEIYVAWRGVTQNNIRDIMTSTSLDGGASFSTPLRVSADEWQIDGCPHAGPSFATSGDRLYIAWRTDGPDGKRSRVNVSWSDTQGRGFSSPLEISKGVADGNHPEIVTKGGQVWAIFEGRDERNSESFGPVTPYVAEVHADKVVPIKSSGTYPQILVLEGGKLAMAWTKQEGNGSKVEFLRARVP